MKKDKISVIVPTYNSYNHIKKNYKPLVESTYVSEVIFIDDGSSDYTPEFLNTISDENKKIKVYIFKENKRQGVRRNQGFELSNENKIVFIDSDVKVNKKFLKYISEFLEKYDIVLYMEGINKKIVDQWNFTIPGNYFAFRREVFKDIGGFWKHMREDTEILMKALEKGYKFYAYNQNIKHLNINHKNTFKKTFWNFMINLKYFELYPMLKNLIKKPLTVFIKLISKK